MMLLRQNINIIMEPGLLMPQCELHKNYVHRGVSFKLLSLLLVVNISLFDDEVCAIKSLPRYAQERVLRYHNSAVGLCRGEEDTNHALLHRKGPSANASSH